MWFPIQLEKRCGAPKMCFRGHGGPRRCSSARRTAVTAHGSRRAPEGAHTALCKARARTCLKVLLQTACTNVTQLEGSLLMERADSTRPEPAHEKASAGRCVQVRCNSRRSRCGSDVDQCQPENDQVPSICKGNVVHTGLPLSIVQSRRLVFALVSLTMDSDDAKGPKRPCNKF